MIEDIYIFDKCTVCGKYKALKNNICVECNKEVGEMPDFLKDLFKKEN